MPPIPPPPKPPKPPRSCPPPPPPRAPRPLPALSKRGPRPMVLLTRRLRDTFAGPSPKLIGIGEYACPGAGMKKQNGFVVESKLQFAELTANPGRALKIDVPRMFSGI